MREVRNEIEIENDRRAKYILVSSVSALIWLSYFSLLVLGLIDNIRGPFFPDILADLGLNATIGAWFFATTSLLAFLGSWTSHRIVKAHSALFLMGVSSIALGAGFAIISRVHTLLLLIPACALFGWGYGALNVSQNVMVYQESAPRLRRRLFAGLHSMYGIAAFIAPFVASGFRWMGATWRECFATLPFLAIAVVILSWSFKSKGKAAEPQHERLSHTEWMACAVFSVMMAGYLWGEISISTRLVQWLRADRLFDPDQANFYLGAFCFTLLAGRVVFSAVSFSRISNWTILLVSSALGAVTYAMALTHSPLWIVVSGLVMSPFFPIAMEQISLTFKSKSTEALGFVIGAGSGSVVLMHVTLGALTDAFGVGNALFAGPVCLALVAISLSVRAFRLPKSR